MDAAPWVLTTPPKWPPTDLRQHSAGFTFRNQTSESVWVLRVRQINVSGWYYALGGRFEPDICPTNGKAVRDMPQIGGVPCRALEDRATSFRLYSAISWGNWWDNLGSQSLDTEGHRGIPRSVSGDTSIFSKNEMTWHYKPVGRDAALR